MTISVYDWLRERRANCFRIAATKTGADRDGWLEDAEYFAALDRLLAQAKYQDNVHWKTRKTLLQRIERLQSELAQAKERKSENLGLESLCDRLNEIFNLDDTPDDLSQEAVEAIETLWQERDGLRTVLAQANARIQAMLASEPYKSEPQWSIDEMQRLRGRILQLEQAPAQPSIESQAAQEYVRDPCICKSTLALIARPDCPIHGNTASPQSEPSK